MSGFNDVRASLAAAVQKALPDMNVYNFVPRSLVPPAAIVRAVAHNAIDYEQMYASGFANWNFTVMIVAGQVDDEAAQTQVGEHISPRSPLIQAVEAAEFESGWARVTRGNVSQMMFGKALYTYAELTVHVRA